jgi:hypothetical protein
LIDTTESIAEAYEPSHFGFRWSVNWNSVIIRAQLQAEMAWCLVVISWFPVVDGSISVLKHCFLNNASS